MRHALIIFFVSALHFVSAENEVAYSMTITPIIEPEMSLRLTVTQSKLTVKRGPYEKEDIVLSESSLKLLETAFAAATSEKWSGTWISTKYLDGFNISVEASSSDKTFKFEGFNGCPPGFSKVLKVLGESANEKELLLWGDMEKSAKQYEDFDSFVRSISEEAAKRRMGEQAVPPKTDRAGG